MWLLIWILLLPCAAAAQGAGTEENALTAVSADGISLTVTLNTATTFTNVLAHYVSMDAVCENAEKVAVRLYDPEGGQASFRTRKQVKEKTAAVRTDGRLPDKENHRCKDLNVYFKSGFEVGTWTIEVIATNGEKEPATVRVPVEIQEPRELRMEKLPEVHQMLTGTEGNEPVPVTEGKIRYVCQDPKDPRFVRDYWLSKSFDLRDTANQKCTRAVFSMALSWLGVDCTPVRMSELVMSAEVEYTYDSVCRKLKNVKRTEGDLETLWAAYEAGEASPILLHFRYDQEGGMHGVLLIARDDEDPELFYAVTSGQPVNTSGFPDGMKRDVVIPILIENGRDGEQIQSPLLKRYHKGMIDQIWCWKKTK